MTSGTLKGGLLAAVAVAALGAAPSFAQDVSACLITKTDTNPFFVKMKEGAHGQGGGARRRRSRPMPARSTATTRARSQAIETCIADGAKGILLGAVRHQGASSTR